MTVLEDEDIVEEIKARMTEKAAKGFLKAENVVGHRHKSRGAGNFGAQRHCLAAINFCQYRNSLAQEIGMDLRKTEKRYVSR
jgi:hypothetical protein